MRIGVSGVGRIGRMHAANVAATDGVTEVVLYDPAPGAAAAVAIQLVAGGSSGRGVGVRAVDTLDELLAAVDGIVVAVPTPFHGDVVHRRPAHATSSSLRRIVRRDRSAQHPPARLDTRATTAASLERSND